MALCEFIQSTFLIIFALRLLVKSPFSVAVPDHSAVYEDSRFISALLTMPEVLITRNKVQNNGAAVTRNYSASRIAFRSPSLPLRLFPVSSARDPGPGPSVRTASHRIASGFEECRQPLCPLFGALSLCASCRFDPYSRPALRYRRSAFATLPFGSTLM